MAVYTVTQVNIYIKSLLAERPILENIYIKGEISNYKVSKNGHAFFTLKDASSQMHCVIYAGERYRLRFAPQDGMQVICLGKVDVYETRGEYQLYVTDIHPDGIGDLQAAYEQMCRKLEAEGLFDEAYKKPLPPYPQRIGVVTSNTGAAVEDIKNILSRRFPLCEIVIVPTLVQGDAAPADIVKSLQFLDKKNVDIIIVGRGGGSLEDLWAFNTEEVARAVFACGTPVISAVGHKTDHTVCDLVADLDAPTPSAAAELAVPDILHEKQRVANLSVSLTDAMLAIIHSEEVRLDYYKTKSVLAGRDKFLDVAGARVSALTERMVFAMRSRVSAEEGVISGYARALNALSPLKVLARGYSVTKHGGKLLTSSQDVQIGDEITVKLAHGSVTATATEVNHNG